jgi:hypothetical protein
VSFLSEQTLENEVKKFLFLFQFRKLLVASLFEIDDRQTDRERERSIPNKYRDLMIEFPCSTGLFDNFRSRLKTYIYVYISCGIERAPTDQKHDFIQIHKARRQEAGNKKQQTRNTKCRESRLVTLIYKDERRHLDEIGIVSVSSPSSSQRLSRNRLSHHPSSQKEGCISHCYTWALRNR